MRSWLICLFVCTLLIPLSTGCKVFRQSSIGSAIAESSLLGRGRSSKSEREISSDEILDPLGARNSNRLLLDDLSLSQLSTTFKARMNGGANESSARKYYEEGQRLYEAGISQLDSDSESGLHQQFFADAANQFRLASASWPDSEIEEESAYFEGESYFFADRYVQSNRAFEKLVANYSGSKYLDLAENRRYAIAVYWLQLAESESEISLADPKRPKMRMAAEARRVLHRIRIDDPTGKLADDASLALAKAFILDKRYYEAANTLEDLRRNYPGSEHQFAAHMLELESRLSGYQGKSYDATPLLKADELLKTIVRQFPQQSEEQLPYLEKQATLIRNQIAERDYSMGQYFERRGENRAAKIYYEKVHDKFRDTEIGSTIEQQIAEVSSKPAKPEQHAKWLVDLFPSPEVAKPVILAGNNETIFR